jgi:hypothetical protein
MAIATAQGATRVRETILTGRGFMPAFHRRESGESTTPSGFAVEGGPSRGAVDRSETHTGAG